MHYTSQGKHVFLAGSQGAGKSTIIDSMKFFEKDATYHQVYITPELKPDVVQLVIEASMEKFMHNIFEPKASKLFILLDDMHFAERDCHDVIPILDLLRHCNESGGLYNTSKKQSLIATIG